MPVDYSKWDFLDSSSEDSELNEAISAMNVDETEAYDTKPISKHIICAIASHITNENRISFFENCLSSILEQNLFPSSIYISWSCAPQYFFKIQKLLTFFTQTIQQQNKNINVYIFHQPTSLFQFMHYKFIQNKLMDISFDTSTYLIFSDDDDVWHPNRVQEFELAIENFPGFAIYGTRGATFIHSDNEYFQYQLTNASDEYVHFMISIDFFYFFMDSQHEDDFQSKWLDYRLAYICRNLSLLNSPLVNSLALKHYRCKSFNVSDSQNFMYAQRKYDVNFNFNSAGRDPDSRIKPIVQSVLGNREIQILIKQNEWKNFIPPELSYFIELLEFDIANQRLLTNSIASITPSGAPTMKWMKPQRPNFKDFPFSYLQKDFLNNYFEYRLNCEIKSGIITFILPTSQKIKAALMFLFEKYSILLPNLD